MKLIRNLGILLLLCLVTSCGTSNKLTTTAVSYQSVRTAQYKEKVPSHAKIAINYSITPEGRLIAIVKNLTDDIMVIDQTKSFFISPDGKSTSYYDPTVRSTANTSFTSETDGTSVNLGAVAGAFGVGGPIRGLLGGVTMSSATTEGSATTQTVTFADQPQISLAPRSQGAMSKQFPIHGVGKINHVLETNSNYSYNDSYCKFSVCISYSLDGANSFEKIETPFYVNSLIVCPVNEHGRVNAALRKVLQNKPDAIHEQWWMLRSVSNLETEFDNICEGSFLDWQ